MAQMTDYLESQLRAHLFRTATFTKPTAIGVKLYTAAPGETGGGTEVTGGSYAPVSIPPLDANWSAPDTTGGLTANVNAATFPAPTAAWGLVVSVSIGDSIVAGTPGNMWFYAPLTVSKTINSGDAAPSFAAGALGVTFN